MLVHWALPKLTELLPENILASLPQAFCNPYLDFDKDAESLPCYNALTGELLFKSATPGARRVSRKMLRQVIARDVDIRWGKAISRMFQTEDGVLLEFDDGETFEAHRVLGADGASSKVRELLVGAERARVERSGLLFATGITRFRDEDKTNAIVKMHPVAAMAMGTSSIGAVGSTSPTRLLSSAVAAREKDRTITNTDSNGG